MPLVSLGDATYPFAAPSLSLMGLGSSKEAGPRAKGLGATHVLLVTDRVLAKLGMVDQIKGQLEAAGLKVTVFDGVDPDPSDKNVHAGAAIYLESKCDALVSLGALQLQLALHPLAVGDVADHRGDKQVGFAGDAAERDLRGEYGPIFPAGTQIGRPMSHGTAAHSRLYKLGPLVHVGGTGRLGYQHIHVAAQQFLAAIAEHLLGRPIGDDDHSAGVDLQDGVGRIVKQA